MRRRPVAQAGRDSPPAARRPPPPGNIDPAGSTPSPVTILSKGLTGSHVWAFASTRHRPAHGRVAEFENEPLLARIQCQPRSGSDSEIRRGGGGACRRQRLPGASRANGRDLPRYLEPPAPVRQACEVARLRPRSRHRQDPVAGGAVRRKHELTSAGRGGEGGRHPPHRRERASSEEQAAWTRSGGRPRRPSDLAARARGRRRGRESRGGGWRASGAARVRRRSPVGRFERDWTNSIGRCASSRSGSEFALEGG